MENFNLLDYIYIEYTLAVLFFTEILKTYLPKPKSEFWSHPKWLTLITSIGLGVLEAKYKLASTDGLSYSKLFVSLGTTVLFYDYFWKLVKDGWKLALNKIKKANHEVIAEDKKITNPEPAEPPVETVADPIAEVTIEPVQFPVENAIVKKKKPAKKVAKKKAVKKKK